MAFRHEVPESAFIYVAESSERGAMVAMETILSNLPSNPALAGAISVPAKRLNSQYWYSVVRSI